MRTSGDALEKFLDKILSGSLDLIFVWKSLINEDHRYTISCFVYSFYFFIFFIIV
ncbi:hypothetical protein PRUPE_6G107200 [Prunus persica]|uniref:Uncharacterized protein n=1 Tax=Prunus persica TaxID=3760 RepID=A0A251NNK6_PRUPE|nr:hypothetical protein PRUPE_6G107200 [Prunus persica]ONI00849.1 hypothetical protein PRUPE_6G107200 [Prunus persica]